MTPPRCRFCISDPSTRLDKLHSRREQIYQKLVQTQEQLWLVTEEIKSIAGDFPTVKGGKRE